MTGRTSPSKRSTPPGSSRGALEDARRAAPATSKPARAGQGAAGSFRGALEDARRAAPATSKPARARQGAADTFRGALEDARRAAPATSKTARARQGAADSTVAIGRRAEDRAAAALARAGYRVVERNVRFRLGELDAVAYDGDTLVFVEVRSRADHRFGGALAAVPPAKQRQVARAAAAYLALRRPTFRASRFDVVAITGDELVIVRDAFRITW